MTASFTNAETWSEYGLLGLVVGALFALVFIVMRTLENKDKRHAATVHKLNSDNTQFIREVLGEAKEERSETNKQFIESNGKLAKAIDELTITIARTDMPANQKKI